MKSFVFLINIIFMMMICVACTKDTPKKSVVDGISDEVYEQLVQQYFYIELNYKMLTNDTEIKTKNIKDLIQKHELYDEAEKYAKENDFHPFEVFPNALYIEYAEDRDQFNETEQTYIEKMKSFLKAFSRLQNEKYDELESELKEELKIKDAYNMFDFSEGT